MTRAEQERLVERYLSGEMPSTDEEEFFIQVAVDPDLRQTLKAYRIVESAIRKHRDAAPQQHSESRARMLSMLNTGTAAQAGNAPAAPAGRIVQPGGRGAMVSTAMFQWIVASVAILAVALGTFVIAPLLDDEKNAAPSGATPSASAGKSITGESGVIADRTAPSASELPSSPSELPSSPIVNDPAAATPSPGIEQARMAPEPERPARRAAERTSPKEKAGTALKQRETSATTQARDLKETSTSQSREKQVREKQSREKSDPATISKRRPIPRITVKDSTLKVRVRMEMPK